MARSIQVYDITFPIDNKILKEKFSSKKQVTIQNKSYDYRIQTQKIQNHNDGIIIPLSIDLTLNDEVIEKLVAEIYISINNGILILNALKGLRLTLIKAIVEILFEAEDPTEYFEIKSLSKEVATNIFKKINSYNKKNFIYNPRFTFKKSGYGKDKLSYEGFSITNYRCATKKSDYDDMFKASVSFEPILKLYQYPPLLKYELNNNPIILRMKENYSFSQYIDNTFKDWVDFYYMISSKSD
ncbi:MAG: hypothetical protein V3U87_15995 [Methylococcaceae bacterium]